MCGYETAKSRIMGQRMNRSQGVKPTRNTGITTSVVKCRNCGLIYSNPQPIPFDIEDHYGVPPEEYWSKEYFKLDTTYFSSEIFEAKKLLSFVKGMTALDIGTGIGKCFVALEKAGFDTRGIEPSASFRDRAIDTMGIDSDRLKLGMLEETEYEDGQFDFITFGAVLEHLYDPSESISRALKWLKPNGVLHLEVPSSDYFMAKVLNLYYKIIGTNYVTNISPMHEPFHLFEFGYKSFTEHASRNNYEIASHRYYVCDIYHVPRLVKPLLRWYMGKTKTGMQLSIWLRKLN